MRRTQTDAPITDQDLDRFRAVQRYAYKACAYVEADLKPETTEREIALLLDDVQRGEGINEFLHVPLVWTGTRTCLGDDLPTDATVERGMPVILRIAPVVSGYPCDVAYSCIVGPNDDYQELFFGLQPIRAFLLERVRAGDTMKRIYQALDARIGDAGWTCVHRALGYRIAPRPDAGTVWNDGPDADRPAPVGLWAIGPHVASNGIGTTWEEILVVTEAGAFWLDDDLPHHRKWAGLDPLPFAV